jgi:cystathionine beta-lyase
LDATQARAWVETAPTQIFDLRPSGNYREGHIASARWALRHQLIQLLGDHRRTLIVADDLVVAELAANDLQKAGVELRILMGFVNDWERAGFKILATPDSPTDQERIDFAFFTHDRHAGNLASARQYLEWEIGLTKRVDEDDRRIFQL